MDSKVSVANMLKDLEGAQNFAAAERLPLPLTTAVTDLNRLFVAAGIGSEDNAATMKYFHGFQMKQEKGEQ